MTAINKMNEDYYEYVSTLLVDGKWSDVFNGSIFSISYNNDEFHVDLTTQTQQPLLVCTWDKIRKISGYFAGVASNNNNSFLFRPQHDNPEKYFITRKYSGKDIMVLGDDDSYANPNNVWKMTYNKYSQYGIHVQAPLSKPNTDNMKEIIQTDKLTEIVLSIITPNTLTMSGYCEYKNNISNNVCLNYCLKSTSDGCNGSLGKYCKSDGIDNDVCITWCKDKNNSCDTELTSFCEQKLNEIGIDEVLKKYPDMCPCFLGKNWSDGYHKSLSSDIPSVVIDNLECWYPRCMSDNDTIKPFKYKLGCGNCNKLSGCVLNTNTDINGNIIGGIKYSTSRECKSITGYPEYQLSDLPPTIYNPCPVDNLETKTGRGNSQIPIFIGIAVVIGVVVVGVGVNLIRKSKHK